MVTEMSAEDERRVDLLRALLAAREELRQESRIPELLGELVELKAATVEETLRFAKTQVEPEPEVAAALYEQAALGLGYDSSKA